MGDHRYSGGRYRQGAVKQFIPMLLMMGICGFTKREVNIMSRSVSTPNGAVAIAYRDVTYMTDEDSQWEWDMFQEDIIQQLQNAFPSLDEADSWIGREDHVVLENSHCQVTISEYCGLAAISLVPIERDCFYAEDFGSQNLSYHWCQQIAKKFNELLGELRHVATFSNGEAVFERIAQ